jgi:hypothetical protein
MSWQPFKLVMQMETSFRCSPLVPNCDSQSAVTANQLFIFGRCDPADSRLYSIFAGCFHLSSSYGISRDGHCYFEMYLCGATFKTLDNTFKQN